MYVCFALPCQKMQSKKQSIIETTIQVVSDTAINAFIAAPLAYLFYGVKSKVIIELIMIMTLINFEKAMSLEDITTQDITTKKTNVTNLKKQCDQLNEKITGIQELTKRRWDNIDNVINVFKTGIILLIFLNLAILFFVVFL